LSWQVLFILADMKPTQILFRGPFSQADLIFGPSGAVYHLGLKPGQLAETIIIVGDPDRVARVSFRFDEINFKQQNREFVTHTGKLGGLPISVISSGIGADNIDILINECDILHNVNQSTRTYNVEKKQLRFIRIGTSGALQKDIPIGSLLRADAALGSDGLPWFCDIQSEPDEILWQEDFMAGVHWPRKAAAPYFAKAPGDLAGLFQEGFVPGFTATMNSFYAGQGRWVGLRPFDKDFVNCLSGFRFSDGRKITNFEMETAAIYAFAGALGHQAVSLLAILANRMDGTFAKDTIEPVERLIDEVLGRLTGI